jgi:hypothetical protein
MKLQDALFNWLQIKMVSDARPDDKAAKDTMLFFEEILKEDHKLTSFQTVERDDTMIDVKFEQEGAEKIQSFDREIVEQLLIDINSNPKYNE